MYITHDLATARNFGQRVGILYRGRIVEYGSIDKVLLSPRHPYTQALLDAISEPDPDNVHKKKRIRIVDESVAAAKYDAQQGSTWEDTVIRPSHMNIKSGSGGCRFGPRCPYIAEACSVEPDLEQKEQGQHAACHVNIKTAADVTAT